MKQKVQAMSVPVMINAFDAKNASRPQAPTETSGNDDVARVRVALRA